MSEKAHMATQPSSGNQSPALVFWRAHTYLCMGADLFARRLVTNRRRLVTCKRCLKKLEKDDKR